MCWGSRYGHCSEKEFVPDEELMTACAGCVNESDENFVKCVEEKFPAPKKDEEGGTDAAAADGIARVLQGKY